MKYIYTNTHVLEYFIETLLAVHILSAVLLALNGLKQSLNLQPNLLPVDNSDDGELNPVLPCTSLPCKWIVPKNRKDSTQQMSVAVFQNMTKKSLLNEHCNPLKILIQDTHGGVSARLWNMLYPVVAL